MNLPPSANAQKALYGGGIAIFMMILTVFLIPDIEANQEAIKNLDLEISEKLEKIESKINKNHALLCHLTSGEHC